MAINPSDPVYKRVRYDGLEQYLNIALTPSMTLITFKADLRADGNAPIASLAANEYIALSLLDANYRLAEIVYLTSYSSGQLEGTIERGVEGTTAVSHPKDNKVVHAATVLDFTLVQDHRDLPNAHPALLDQAKAYADGLMSTHVAATDPHSVYAKKAGDTFTGPVIFDGASNTTTVVGTLDIPVGAVLTVEGELRITGKFFLNGKEIIASNTLPATPAANTIVFQTFG